MVAVKSLWVLLKSFSTNFSFKRDNGVRVPDHKPDKRIRYNRLRPQWHRPYYPSADPEMGRGAVSSSKSYQDYLNGNGGDGDCGDGNHHNSKDFENFINSDSDYEDGDSDAEDFDDDFTTTDEDEDSDLDSDDDDCEELCEVCQQTFPSNKMAYHREKKKHYGCPQCDSIFPTEKALQFHKEQLDHFDFVSDYGTDDAASFGSGSVRDASSASSSSGVSSSYDQRSIQGGGNNSTGSNSNNSSSSSSTNNNNAKSSSSQGRSYNNNNNYHCYANQLHASWYEGDDEEEKGLLNTKR